MGGNSVLIICCCSSEGIFLGAYFNLGRQHIYWSSDAVWLRCCIKKTSGCCFWDLQTSVQGGVWCYVALNHSTREALSRKQVCAAHSWGRCWREKKGWSLCGMIVSGEDRRCTQKAPSAYTGKAHEPHGEQCSQPGIESIWSQELKPPIKYCLLICFSLYVCSIPQLLAVYRSLFHKYGAGGK